MSKLETNTIDNISGSSTLNIGDTNATNITIDNGVTTLDFGTGISTVSNMPDAFKNTPAFSATLSGTQSISNNSFTKVQFDTEDYDNGGVYDNSTNYRFTPGENGKFVIYGSCGIASIDNGKYFTIRIYKNGSSFITPVASHTGVHGDQRFSFIFTINNTSSTDYYEVFIYHNHGNARNASDCRFAAYKLIGV
jgi:hypothetical protein